MLHNVGPSELTGGPPAAFKSSAVVHYLQGLENSWEFFLHITQENNDEGSCIYTVLGHVPADLSGYWVPVTNRFSAV